MVHPRPLDQVWLHLSPDPDQGRRRFQAYRDSVVQHAQDGTQAPPRPGILAGLFRR